MSPLFMLLMEQATEEGLSPERTLSVVPDGLLVTMLLKMGAEDRREIRLIATELSARLQRAEAVLQAVRSGARLENPCGRARRPRRLPSREPGAFKAKRGQKGR
ncbi:MAG TPA: hypothetical protein VNZ52_07300 [Candidatus Thermoplasmatota archaeon]|nr:hypothetical protein [Candidatus Thermoplasmatota archaeon]